VSWTTPEQLIAQVEHRWSKGEILGASYSNAPLFPLQLKLRRPTAREVADRFDDVRAWVRTLRSKSIAELGYGYELELKEQVNRVQGANAVPVRVTVPSEHDALRLIGKTAEARRFALLAEETSSRLPALATWVARKPMSLLEHEAVWSQVLAVAEYFRDNPRPGIYLRQLDIEGVDTKFIESRRRLLAELLDLVLLPEDVDTSARGARGFNRRYGLRDAPLMVQFRILDPRITVHDLTHLVIPAADFARLRLPIERVIITENKVSGLAFPSTDRALVIFGLGYGLDRLALSDWLAETAVHYWGDIDTHGFQILDRLRCTIPSVRSFLMDRETLLDHRALWSREPKESRCRAELRHLTGEETALYDDLRRDQLASSVRLEQERLRFASIERAARALG